MKKIPISIWNNFITLIQVVNRLEKGTVRFSCITDNTMSHTNISYEIEIQKISNEIDRIKWFE